MYRERRQRRTEPRAACNVRKNLAKFGRMVFEICERTNRQTDGHTITVLRTPAGDKVNLIHDLFFLPISAIESRVS